MADNNWDDIFNGEPEETSPSNGNNPTQAGNEGSNQDVKPVKLSKLATAGIVVGVAVVAFILVMTLRSCSIEKKVNSTQSTEPAIVATQVSPEQAEKPVDAIPKKPDSIQNNQEVAPTSVEVVNPTVSQQVSPTEAVTGKDQPQGAAGDSGLVEVVPPILGDAQQSKGIVVAKHSYLYQSSYVYGVSISVLVNENAQTVQYFCPKKTFDALNSTDAVNVVYQRDSAGLISIISISK